MKLTKHLLRRVVRENLNENYLPYAEIIFDKKHISEYHIGKNFRNNDYSTIRALLYRMQEKGIVSYFKVKDKHKRYTICQWHLNRIRILSLASLKTIKKEVYVQPSGVYECRNKCRIYDLDDAMEIYYKCTECNSLLDPKIITKDYEQQPKSVISSLC